MNLFPSATGWLRVLLYLTIGVFVIAEVAILVHALRRREHRATEVAWTIAPVLVLALILYLAR